MVMERWTFSDEYVIPVETNEKEKVMSTCRFHAYGGILSASIIAKTKTQAPFFCAR
jgi:hypothetical protein